MVYKILWFISIGIFLVSSVFLGWLGDVQSFFTSFNSGFWGKLPWEFQVIFFGFAVIVPIFLLIRSFSGRE